MRYKKSDFYYELPPELIAQRPCEQRTASRLLTLDGGSGRLADRQFRQLPELLRSGDLLVLNDTRVIPARLFGRKASGGRVEVLIERVLDQRRALAQLRASRSPKPRAEIVLDGEIKATVAARHDDLFELLFAGNEPLLDILERCGHVPLPPYIERPAGAADRDRYQTVYARQPGAVAAPTAGLHFDDALLQRLAAAGIEQAFVTLHVGAGTFQPVRSERLEDHQMHKEWATVSAETCAQIAAARARGGQIVAVGTTVVRSLEAAARAHKLKPFQGETDIFIYPGFEFRVVDRLITNFHLPESTLTMLVAAFAGFDHTMSAYRYAVRQRYRFFSYGDAMLISKQ